MHRPPSRRAARRPLLAARMQDITAAFHLVCGRVTRGHANRLPDPQCILLRRVSW
jgi:hypothetical protein